MALYRSCADATFQINDLRLQTSAGTALLLVIATHFLVADGHMGYDALISVSKPGARGISPWFAPGEIVPLVALLHYALSPGDESASASLRSLMPSNHVVKVREMLGLAEPLNSGSELSLSAAECIRLLRAVAMSSVPDGDAILGSMRRLAPQDRAQFCVKPDDDLFAIGGNTLCPNSVLILRKRGDISYDALAVYQPDDHPEISVLSVAREILMQLSHDANGMTCCE